MNLLRKARLDALLSVLFVSSLFFAFGGPAWAASDPDFTIPDLSKASVTLTTGQSLRVESIAQCTQLKNGEMVAACSDKQYLESRLNDPVVVATPKSRGYAICGGLDERGRLQKACGFSPATHYGKSSGGCKKKNGEYSGPGGCYTCPAGYKRTVHRAKGAKACRKGRFKNKTYAPATFARKKFCPEGQFFAAAKGGSCWSCPPYYDRVHIAPAGSKYACVNKSIVWQSAVYPEPGIFGLKGGAEVVAEILSNPGAVNAAIEVMAKDEFVTNKSEFRRAQWQRILGDPNNSPVIAAIAYHKVIEGAMEAKASKATKQLAASFAAYIHARRTFVAQDALDAFDNWWKAEELRFHGGDKIKGGMSDIMGNYTHAPIDFHAQMMSTLATTTGASLTTLVAFSQPKFVYSIFPHWEDYPRYGKVASKTFQKLGTIRKTAKSLRTAGKAALKMANTTANAMRLANIGPQIAITLTAEAVTRVIANYIKLALARPKLEKHLREAQKPVNLAAMLSSETGLAEAIMYWGLATSPKPGYSYSNAQKNMFKKAFDQANAQVSATATSGTGASAGSCEICLFADTNYRGRSACVTKDVAKLGTFSLKNTVSSIRFKGNACRGVSAHLYRHNNYRNDNVLVHADTPSLTAVRLGKRNNWNDKAASIRYVRK